nr:uncharacterized protein LOC107447898 [Parasteatoda tepidariorum]
MVLKDFAFAAATLSSYIIAFLLAATAAGIKHSVNRILCGVFAVVTFILAVVITAVWCCLNPRNANAQRNALANHPPDALANLADVAPGNPVPNAPVNLVGVDFIGNGNADVMADVPRVHQPAEDEPAEEDQPAE